jgi:hypothetical protein
MPGLTGRAYLLVGNGGGRIEIFLPRLGFFFSRTCSSLKVALDNAVVR